MSPLGSVVAFVTEMAQLEDDNYRYDLWLSSTTEEKTSDVFTADYLCEVEWSPSGEALTFLAWRHGRNNAAVYRMSLPDRRVHQVVELSDDVPRCRANGSSNRVHRVSADGSRVVYLRMPQEITTTSSASRLYDGEMTYSGLLANEFPSRPAFWIASSDGSTSRAVWRAPCASGQVDQPDFAWLPRRHELYVLYSLGGCQATAATGARRGLARVDLASSRVDSLIDDLGGSLRLTTFGEGTALRFFSEGRVTTGSLRADFAWHELQLSGRDARTLRRLSAEEHADTDTIIQQSTKQMVLPENLSLSDCSSDRASSTIACILQGTNVPPEVAVIRVTGGHLPGRPKVVTDLNPTYRTLASSEVLPLAVQTPDGNSASAGLLKPNVSGPEGPRPLLVMLYNTYKPGKFVAEAGWVTSWPAQAFSSHGYAVLLLNLPSRAYVRGDVEDAKRRLADDSVATVLSAVDSVVRSGVADPKRVGVLGWSYGSFVTDYLLTRHPQVFRAAASSEGGLYGPAGYFWTNDLGRSLQRTVLGGGPYGPSLEAWKVLSPYSRAAYVRTPVLMEYLKEHGYALEFYHAVVEQGGSAELVFYSDDLHVFRRPRNRYASMTLNYDWFNFWLLDEEDPSAGKVKQYERWRALRRRIAAR